MEVVFADEPTGNLDSGVPLSVLSPPAGRSRAAVLHIQGGGMVTAAARADLTLAGGWVEQLGVTVVSPEYRLAPEHRFPAGAEDCFAALGWAAAGAGRARPAGCSCARCWTTTPCRGRGSRRSSPPPGTAGTTCSAGRRCSAAPAAPTACRRTPPGARARLDGLPPAYLDEGSADVFLDEDVAYARRLWVAGVPCELHVWAGGFHGFEFSVPDAPVSVAARRARTDWLRRLFDARQGEPERRP